MRQQALNIILAVIAVTALGYIYFLFTNSASPLQPQASIQITPEATPTGDREAFVRVGQVTNRAGNAVTIKEIDVGSTTIEVTAENPVRTLNAQGLFEISPQDQLTLNDIVSFNFVIVNGRNILRSVDILDNK